VRDKDGISAATLFISLAGRLAAQGTSIAERLTAFTDRFGAFASDQVSIRVTDLAVITRAMARLRAEPPERIGPARVTRVDDLVHGFDDLPPSDVLRFLLDDGSRVVVRPSGTEPKLKIYVDAFSADGTAPEREAAASARVTELSAGIEGLIER